MKLIARKYEGMTSTAIFNWNKDRYTQFQLTVKLWPFYFGFRIRQKWMCEEENTNKRWYLIYHMDHFW